MTQKRGGVFVLTGNTNIVRTHEPQCRKLGGGLRCIVPS